MAIFPGFVGPTYRSASRVVNAETCLNLIPEFVGESGSPKAPDRYALMMPEGFSQQAAASQSPVWTTFEEDGRAWAVIGFIFYEVNADWSLTSYGPIARDNNPVTISSNGKNGGHQLFVTSGTNAYIFDTVALTLNQVHVLDGLALMGAYIDSYFLCLGTDSKIRCSAPLDGTSWPALQVALRESGADACRSMLVTDRVIWLIGSQSSEVWVNTGDVPFPFTPIAGAFTHYGIAGTFAGTRVGDTVIWLEQNRDGYGTVVMPQQFSPTRISTVAVEHAIQSYKKSDGSANVSDAEAFSYQRDGHEFFVLTFPSVPATWVYDRQTGQWHERGHWNKVLAAFDAYRPRCHMFAFGKHIFGDRAKGILWQGSLDQYTDVDGDELVRIRRTPHVNIEAVRMFYDSLHVDMDNGVGQQNGQGQFPQVRLRKSSDGGATWGSERWKTAGAVGKYLTRVRWVGLGSARDAVFEIAMSDPFPSRIVGAYLDFTKGTG